MRMFCQLTLKLQGETVWINPSKVIGVYSTDEGAVIDCGVGEFVVREPAVEVVAELERVFIQQRAR